MDKTIEKEIIESAQWYENDGWELTQNEIEQLLEIRNEGVKTMNGDTSTIELTIRQFDILLSAWLTKESV